MRQPVWIPSYERTANRDSRNVALELRADRCVTLRIARCRTAIRTRSAPYFPSWQLSDNFVGVRLHCAR